MFSDLSFDDQNIFGNMILLSIFNRGVFVRLFLNSFSPIFENYVVFLIDDFVYLYNDLFLLFDETFQSQFLQMEVLIKVTNFLLANIRIQGKLHLFFQSDLFLPKEFLSLDFSDLVQ